MSRQSPGILTGRLLTVMARRITHGGVPEQFETRALIWNAEHGVALFDTHAGSDGSAPRRPVGIVFPTGTDTEVRVASPLPDTPAGRRVASDIRAGKLKGLSVEFSSTSETRADGLRRIARANLTGLATVETPAYPSAEVEIRHKKRRHWMPPIPRSA